MSARVLVVDDILPNVKLLEAKLSAEYYDVLTATSGEEALTMVANDSPDIVLLDVMMPGMDGFEVCRRIKADARVAHIPVVMVTALTDAIDRVKGLEVGADDFLSKPVNDMALMARVRSLVRLKMSIDEWRARETTASQLGVVDETANVMNESVEGAKILVIEDQEFEAETIRQTLQTDNGEVTHAGTGMEAVSMSSQSDFDMIIVSMNLQNEDSLRLCSHLRSNERTRSLPILMVASEEDMERVAHGLEIGAHDYILRPIDRNELLARIRTQIRKKRFQERLRSTYEVSLSMALTDSLTGLYNRRYLDVHLKKLLENNKESKKSMCVLMFDIDHFKHVNDTYGHGVGDEVLKTFAFRLKDDLRSFDLVARMGGEEFVVVMPDITEELAYIIAERLRCSIADKKFKCSAPEGEITVTTSIGGTLVTHGNRSVEEILECADKMLYDAKNTGRNCVVFENVGKLDPEQYISEKRQHLE
jgi:two-component system cell cycle response regulator